MLRVRLFPVECELMGSTERLCLADPEAFARVVLWLEDRVVRHLDISEREPLRAGKRGDAVWDGAFASYLEAVGCPPALTGKPLVQLDWLSGFAVSLVLEADDSKAVLSAAERRMGEASSLAGVTAAGASSSSSSLSSSSIAAAASSSSSGSTGGVPSTAGSDALERDTDIAREARALATAIGLDDPPDTASTTDILRQCGQHLRQRILPFSNAHRPDEPGARIDIHSLSPGFTTGDPDVDAASVVLRMLYVGSLREKQDLSNAIVETAQAATMNVRTDARLGKVGY
jgi:hypothetical protein